MADRFLGMLGLAARARKLAAGSDLACEAAAKSAPLLLISSDASENTAKRISDKAAFYGCELLKMPYDGATVGHAIGKRGAVMAVAVLDENFCRPLLKDKDGEN